MLAGAMKARVTAASGPELRTHQQRTASVPSSKLGETKRFRVLSAGAVPEPGENLTRASSDACRNWLPHPNIAPGLLLGQSSKTMCGFAGPLQAVLNGIACFSITPERLPTDI